MAYIPGYTYDIFISYAHLDNLMLPGQQHGWIELFYQSLNLKLAQRIGRMDAVKIWWDSKKLDGSRLFDNSIEEGIRDSAIMISLISPGYLQSEYCRRELDLFATKAASEKAGSSVGDSARLIKVLLNNIPYATLPPQFGRATGFPFYKAEDSDDFGEPLNQADPIFAEQLKDLRDALVRIFEAFPKDQPATQGAALSGVTAASRGTLPTAAGVAVDGPGKGFRIFFGEVSDSLRTAKKRTISDLEKNGYTIITNIPPPEEASAHEQKVTECMKQVNLSVHLLDQYPGREISGTDTWYPKKQAELALSLAPSKLIWVPGEMDEEEVEEEAYKTFLRGLSGNSDPNQKYEFIRGSKSELTSQIMDYANAITQARVRQESNEKISVLVDTHFSDQQYAFSLGQALLKNNMQPYINPQEDDPRKNIQILGDRISQVNKLVFLYGNVSREWVLERMSAALQLIVTNNYPIDDFYVYLAPPNKMNDDIKLNQRFMKVNVLNHSAEPDLTAGALDEFVADLRKSAA